MIPVRYLKIILSTLSALLVSVMLASCGNQTPVGPGQSAAGGNHTRAMSFVWDDSSILPLGSAESTFTRAFFESSSRIMFPVSQEVATYPGFEAATDNSFSSDRSQNGPRIMLRPVSDTGFSGTIYFKVISYVSEQTSGRVGVCLLAQGLGQRKNDAFARNFERGGVPYELTFNREGQTPQVDVTGVENSPLRNFFGGWRAIDLRMSVSNSHEGERCESEYIAPGIDPMADDSGVTYQTAAPKVVMPFPGWPRV